MQYDTTRLILLGALLSTLLACASPAPLGVTEDTAPTVESLSRSGPYQIRAYNTAPVPEAYAGATIYYPLDTDGFIGGVAISPGYTQSQRNINWWGSRLASHGYAALVLDTRGLEDRPAARAAALDAAIEVLRNESARSGSPLEGRISARRMAVMGHSMGGGGALAAASADEAQLAAAIPFTPWFPDGDFSDLEVPTLIIAGEADQIAPVAEHAWQHFQSIPETTPKAYLEVDDGDHFIGNNRSPQWHPMLGRYAIAWLKLYMDGDERYRPFLYGEIPQQDEEHLSRYVTSP